MLEVCKKYDLLMMEGECTRATGSALIDQMTRIVRPISVSAAYAQTTSLKASFPATLSSRLRCSPKAAMSCGSTPSQNSSQPVSD